MGRRSAAWVVCLGLAVWVALLAEAAGSAGEGQRPVEQHGGGPDPLVLRQLTEQRGPYRGKQVLTAPVGREEAEEEVCRPPSCKVSRDSLVIKLRAGLTPGNLAGAARRSAKSIPSERLSTTPLRGVFESFDAGRLKAAGVSGGKPLLNPHGKPIDLTRWYEMPLEGREPKALLEELRLDDRIEVVEYKYERGLTVNGSPRAVDGASIAAVPTNDPRRVEQWHIASTNTDDAWQWLADNGYSQWGDRDFVVAVIDTGVDYTHEDLAGNMWVNQGEIPGNNIDDDLNGFKDDVHGVSVVSSASFHTGNPQDDHGHGTHVAGIIAAQGGNGLGVIGVAPNVQIMAIKAAQYNGVLTTTDVAEAITYAREMGADVINMSFGGAGRSTLEEEALGVAFGTSVLVAAAGNNGRPNEPLCGPFVTFYPAAYNYVIGVMAELPGPDEFGNYRAGFSNWDCASGNAVEYEVMAPGVDVMSTLPGNGYAAWDGTSMAAPVVSGIAALVRARFPDRSVYSSRFIMGQLASTGAIRSSYRSSDAMQALTSVPNPDLTYLEHWLWDGPELAAGNNDDGFVDAGETVELAVVIKNRWGSGANVQVTLEAQAEGAVFPDPYVSWEAQTVNYGAVGSFATDDNGLIYESGLVTGVSNPFRLTVAPGTPNDHIIPVRVTITAGNGLDPLDATTYTTTSSFQLVVRSGRVLPTFIDGDAPGTPGGDLDTDGVQDNVVTLDDSRLWLVTQPTLIAWGTTLKVTEGATVIWDSNYSLEYYGEQKAPYLQTEGFFLVEGTPERPVNLRPSALLTNAFLDRKPDVVFLRNPTPYQVNGVYLTPEEERARIQIRYANLRYPFSSSETNGNGSGPASMDHVMITTGGYRIGTNQISWSGGDWHVTRSRIETGPPYYSYYTQPFRGSKFSDVLFDGTRLSSYENRIPYVEGSVFLATQSGCYGCNIFYFTQYSWEGASAVSVHERNAFLNPLWAPLNQFWIRPATQSATPSSPTVPWPLAENFWGTTNRDLIDLIVYDQADDFNLQPLVYEPILETAPVTAYPFVVDVQVLDGEGNVRSDGRFSSEPTTWRVTFNRDMDPGVQPNVSFGPAEPYTDFVVRGDWEDARTWVGRVTISPVATDGYQYVRVQGAVAADDAWLVTGNDKARFRFEVVTSGTEALNLQAVGGEGYVDLSWSQNDYDTLLGFNIYRSTLPGSGFVRVNQTLVGNAERAWRDTSVQPGVQYYYYFTVMLDGAESGASNTASARPVDTVAPVLTHTPVTSAAYGANLLIQATATDNIAITAVTLYYRPQGETTYSSLPMALNSGANYRASIPGAVMLPPGVEYYLEATDGATSSFSGRAATPHVVAVLDAPVVSSVSPSAGSAAGGTAIAVYGANFKSGATVTLGGGACTPVTWVSVSQLSCTTPARTPGTVSVTVTNPDGAADTRASAYTYTGATADVAVSDIVGTVGQSFDVAISVSAVTGLLSFEGVVSFDSAHLRLDGVRTGSLVAGWSVFHNSPSAGVLNFAAASATAVSGSGSLLILEFTVLAGSTASSSITVSQLELNAGAIGTAVTNGNFNWFPGYGISGAVSFWKDSNIPLVAQLSLDGGAPVNSQSNGVFGMSGLSAAQHTLSVSKADEINDSVDSYDAALVLRHVVQLGTPLSAVQQLAADTDNNGDLSALDASYILQASVGLRTLPFDNHEEAWAFSPASYSWNPLSQTVTGANFQGIFIGDVDGSWSDNAIAGFTPGLRLLNPRILGNGNFAVDVAVITTGTEIIGIDLSLQFSSGATYRAVTGASATSGWFIVPNVVNGNTLRVAMSGIAGFTSTSTVLTVEFAVTDANQYFVTGSGKLNGGAVYFENLPFAMVGSPVSPCGDGVPYTTTTWQMIALPCTPGVNSVGGAFGDASLSGLTSGNYGVSGTGWALFERNTTTQNYDLLPLGSATSLGKGYWFKSYQAPVDGKLRVTGTETAKTADQTDGCPTINGCVTVALATASGQNRFNLVGNPFAYDIDWANVRVRVNGTVYTPSQAQEAGYLANQFWSWNGSNYDTGADVTPDPGARRVPYFRAFWVNVLPGAHGLTVELLLPAQRWTTAQVQGTARELPWYLAWLDWLVAPARAEGSSGPFLPPEPLTAVEGAQPPASPGSGTVSPSATLVSSLEWYVQLKVDEPGNGFADHYNYLGKLLTAAEGYDVNDLVSLPPYAAPYLTLTFPRPEWGERADDYDTEFRLATETTSGGKGKGGKGATESRDSWYFEVRSDRPGTQLILGWQGPTEILQRSRLVDENTGKTVCVADHPAGYPVLADEYGIASFIWQLDNTTCRTKQKTR